MDTPAPSVNLEKDAIEKEVQSLLAAPLVPRGKRPVMGAVAEPQPPTIESVKEAERSALRMEAFVDQALHTRIVLTRGAYVPGPRDAFVRHRILEWLMTINGDNASI